MSKIYSDEEKRSYLDQYKVSGKTKTEFARDNHIPEATFRNWLKDEVYSEFGVLSINSNDESKNRILQQPIIFANENIRIELRQGYDKEFLKKIIEVIVNDK